MFLKALERSFNFAFYYMIYLLDLQQSVLQRMTQKTPTNTIITVIMKRIMTKQW